ncbi:pro-opiomelanocortin B-like [Ahaetulla prasina]|uniref:pro-opiomelanocortin B-like n=1 Tax=Ahaetulla prasina TaxID=499056 RepID=UPI00264842E1|nr:pro-opiomelanocortin B-like [Ahaetulla prasina]
MLNSQGSNLWAIMRVLLIHSVAGVHILSWCWDKDTEVKMMECLRACSMDLSNESPVYPGNGHMQPLSENIPMYIHWNKFGKSKSNGDSLGNKRKNLFSDSIANLFLVSSETQESWERNLESHQESRKKRKGKRSYAMEHFRWGKPVGRKKRPVKPKQDQAAEEGTVMDYPEDFRTHLNSEIEYPEAEYYPDE